MPIYEDDYNIYVRGKYLIDSDFDYLNHYASSAAIDDKIAVVAMSNTGIEILDINNGISKHYIQIEESADRVTFANGKDIIFYDLESQKIIQRMTGHKIGVSAFKDFLEDDTLLFSGSQPYYQNPDLFVRAWDIRTGKCVHQLPTTENTIGGISSIEGKEIVAVGSGEKGAIMGWDMKNFTTIHSIALSFRPISIHPLKYSPRSEESKQEQKKNNEKKKRKERIAAGLEDEDENEEEEEESKRKEKEKEEKDIKKNNGEKKDHVMVSGIKREIKIYDLEKETMVDQLQGHDNSVYAFQIFHDKIAVSASVDQTIKVWDIEQGECLRTMVTEKQNWEMKIFKDKLMTLMEGQCNSEGYQFQLRHIMVRM